jgi:rSAM/selenodomain-associated transferase 2
MISVVIPVYNEARRLPGLLARLRAEPEAVEVIVVDGGSSDDTPSVAEDSGVSALSTGRGRGQQLAAGAEVAAGDIVLFLHADSHFPAGGLKAITTHLANPEIIGGNFRLIFDGDSDFSRWLTGFYAWIRRLGLYYGDSGIFLRRDVLADIGGIRPIALMEDYDLVRRLEAAGKTVCIDDPPLVTSSRKFEGRHPVVIFCGWLKMHFLFSLGISPDRLAAMYYGEKS